MLEVSIAASDIINASATATTGSIVTIPGGRWLSADVQLSSSIALAGTSAPRVTFHIPGGTSGAAPADGSVLARITLTGLALTTVTSASTTEIYVYGGDNGCTLDFTAGASGSSSVTINGFLI